MSDPMSAIGPQAAAHIQDMLKFSGYDVPVSGEWDARTAQAFADWAQGLGPPAAAASGALTMTLEETAKPDWKSGTVLFLIVGLVAQAAKYVWPDLQIDTAGLAADAADTITMLSMLGAWWRRRVATGPLRIRRAAPAG